MKILNFIFCLTTTFAALTGSVAAQEIKRNQSSPQAIPQIAAKQTDAVRMGSADKLIGKVYVLTIFISAPDNPWKKQDKLRMIEKQKEAQKWLVSQAAEYDVELAFENGNFGLTGDDVSVLKIPVSDNKGAGMYVNWGSDLLREIGYKSPLGLWNWVQEKTDCASLQVVVYSNSTGVSYSLPFREELNVDKYFVEVSFLHRYHPTGPELYASTIAHENLHLYDAWDLYNSYMQTNDVASKAQKYFPNDIMHRNTFDLAQMEVNELTAWRVGWSADEKPWYKWFKPGK